MKIISPPKKVPSYGDTIVRRGFVIWKTISNETRCLEVVSWEEVAVERRDLHSNAPCLYWEPVRFIP